MEEFQKLFVENEVLKDSVTGLQQQYRSTAESNEVSRIFQYLVVEHKALTQPAYKPAGYFFTTIFCSWENTLPLLQADIRSYPTEEL